jgi:hypothetical protein
VRFVAIAQAYKQKRPPANAKGVVSMQIDGIVEARVSETFAQFTLAQELAVTANRFGFFPGPALRRLFVGAPQLHLPENPFALHFLLQRAKRLVDVVVSYRYLHVRLTSLSKKRKHTNRPGIYRPGRREAAYNIQYFACEVILCGCVGKTVLPQNSLPAARLQPY